MSLAKYLKDDLQNVISDTNYLENYIQNIESLPELYKVSELISKQRLKIYSNLDELHILIVSIFRINEYYIPYMDDQRTFDKINELKIFFEYYFFELLRNECEIFIKLRQIIENIQKRERKYAGYNEIRELMKYIPLSWKALVTINPYSFFRLTYPDNEHRTYDIYQIEPGSDEYYQRMNFYDWEKISKYLIKNYPDLPNRKRITVELDSGYMSEKIEKFIGLKPN